MKPDFILDFIKDKGDCTKEYELLSYIDKYHPEFFAVLGQNPSLFKQHFFLFNHLYKLNQQLIANDHCLIISALEIRLCELSKAGTQIGNSDPLKEFYLDESNLRLSDHEITQMMQQFWRKYMAQEKKVEAIKILSLENEKGLSKEIVKKKYNQLAKEHHPDKGGDKNRFIKIKQAYEELKLLI
jgi:hypothetical protein